MLLVLLVLLAGCSDDQQVHDTGPDAAAGTGFPYLVLDAARVDARFGLIHATDRILFTEGFPGRRLMVFGVAETSLTSPRLWLLSSSTGSDFFRGNFFKDPGWQPIPIGQGRAFIRTGPIGSTVIWQTGDDPDSDVITAEALLIEPAALIDVWANINLSRIGEITLNLIDGRPDATERYLLDLLRSSASYVDGVSATEVRGKPALRIVSATGVIYQWMETSTVTAQLIVSDPIDPTAALEALLEIDQTTWEATLQEAPFPRGAGTDTTTAAAEGDLMLVIDTLEVDQLPDLIPCGTPSTRSGVVNQITFHPSPVGALASFLEDPNVDDGVRLAQFGYHELREPDGSITYGRGSGRDYVTLVSIEQFAEGWSVVAWEASGC